MRAQVLNVTATSSNPQLIPTPSVTYPLTNPATGNIDTTSGSLTFTALPNVSGTAVITVTVTDNGGTANGGVNTATHSSRWWSTRSTSRPRSARSPIPAAILENAGTQSLVVSGITSGLGDPVQFLKVTAASGNTGLIPSVGVSYTSPQTLAALTYTPNLRTPAARP